MRKTIHKATRKPKMTTTIPFSGFYESIHSQNIDDALRQITSDSSGSDTELTDRIFGEWNCGEPYLEYAQLYLELFEVMFREDTGIGKETVTTEIPHASGYVRRSRRYIGPRLFHFDTLDSPREYNFATDRIFAFISRKTVRAMWRMVDRELLNRLIAEKFTSCSGFISGYGNSLAAWLDPECGEGFFRKDYGGPVTTWDHNQIGTLLEATLETAWRVDGGQLDSSNWEYGIVEDIDANGDVSNLVYKGLTKEGERIARIASYLREREERKFAA